MSIQKEIKEQLDHIADRLETSIYEGGVSKSELRKLFWSGFGLGAVVCFAVLLVVGTFL